MDNNDDKIDITSFVRIIAPFIFVLVILLLIFIFMARNHKTSGPTDKKPAHGTSRPVK